MKSTTMKRGIRTATSTLTAALTAALIANCVTPCLGQEAETPPEKKSAWDFLPDGIKNGKFNVNSLLRWEYADQDAHPFARGGADPKQSNAFTIRNRVGFTTASMANFKSSLEFEDVTAIGGYDNYNPAGLKPESANRTVIADPEATEINQAWLAYENWDAAMKGGRQKIVLDDSRWIGDVIWRQNQQTYDAATFNYSGLDKINLFYGYIWNVNRILGDNHPAGDWESDSHIFNVSYDGFKYGKLVAYSYLLDLENAAVSSASYGASFAGSAPVTDTMSAVYRAEYAHQTDYGDAPSDFGVNYYKLELGATHGKKFNYGVGYEVLGSDSTIGSGQLKRATMPLSTAHKFNGWADLFLATPPDGLEDLYVWAGGTLPGNVPLKVFWHEFSAEQSGNDYGHEFNAVATRKFGKYFTALIKYAHYWEGDQVGFATPPTDRFWLQLAFNY